MTDSVPMSAPARLVVVTGLSGAGKSHVSRAFEDMGWGVIDNLPLSLVEPLVDQRIADATRTDGSSRTVVVLDARLAHFGSSFPSTFRRMKERPGLDASLIFVEADEEVLLRRYSETRRPHPLGGDPAEAVRREKRELAELRSLADSVVDTTDLTVHELRARVIRLFADAGDRPVLRVQVQSFGFKHGLPPESDLVFDVRFLPNPHFVADLRPKTGEDPAVSGWLESHPETAEFYGRMRDLIEWLLPRYAAEHKSYLTVAIGCTGGRHRSVYLASKLAADLARTDFTVRLFHRDAARE